LSSGLVQSFSEAAAEGEVDCSVPLEEASEVSVDDESALSSPLGAWGLGLRGLSS
jgi:hypothetical protein